MSRSPETRAAGRRSAFDIAVFAVAIVALTFASRALVEPWANARVLVIFKMTRGPGAAIVLATAIASALSAVQALAAARAGRAALGVAHMILGAALCTTAAIALLAIRSATSGIIAGAAAHVTPARGLVLWSSAGGILLALGAVELVAARKGH